MSTAWSNIIIQLLSNCLVLCSYLVEFFDVGGGVIMHWSSRVSEKHPWMMTIHLIIKNLFPNLIGYNPSLLFSSPCINKSKMRKSVLICRMILLRIHGREEKTLHAF
jgi:hypothetical protein